MKASKFKRSFLLLFTVSLIFAALTIPCSAEESGFTFDDISDNEIDKIWERIELKPIEDPEITKGFCCFSVNDQGNYALGFDGFLKSTEEKKVLIYNANGTYLYGFSFSVQGGFGLGWDNETLVIYTVRSDLAIYIDENGQCLDMKSIQNTSENSEYWSKEIDVNTRNVNGIIYKAKPWLTSSEGYSRFVRILPNGEEEVLFDNTLGEGLRTLLFVLGFVLLYVIAAICFIYNYIAKASIAGLVIKLINDRSKNDRKS